jgi:hypothetical protein
VIVSAFLAVGLLAALDSMEHVPAISAYLPRSIRVYEAYDLLAMGVIFGAARSFSRGSLIGLAALFILLHVPGVALSIRHEPAEAGRTLLITIGLAVGLNLTPPEDGTTMNDLLARADAAMYRAKARGGNRAEFYSD